MSKVVLLMACCVALSSVQRAKADSAIWVGVFEDVDGGNFMSPGMASPHVRVAFKKDGADWTAARSDLPTMVTWAVIYDGRKLGTIISKKTNEFYASGDVNIQVITTKPTDVPTVKSGAKNFSYTSVVPKTRPLVLASAPYFRDPEGWQSTVLSPAERQLAIKVFRKKFPTMEHCDQPEEQPIHMIPYSDAEILFLKAYRSKNGEAIFGMRMDDKRSNCGFFDDEKFFDYWFVLRNSGSIQLLDSEMVPMDAADFDNSGKSEWIFQTSRGEDEDGYELFYDDFAKKVSFSWTYH